MKPKKHATVRIGEYTVPLIGIPKEATDDECAKCGRFFHLCDLELNEKGKPICLQCRQAKPSNEHRG